MVTDDNNSAEKVTNKIANSKMCKAIFLSLAILYFLGGVAAFVAASLLETTSEETVMGRELVRSGMGYGIVCVACATSLTLAGLHHKLADLVGGCTALLTAYVAFKGLIYAINNGFSFYASIELFLVLPSSLFIVRKLLRKQSS